MAETQGHTSVLIDHQPFLPLQVKLTITIASSLLRSSFKRKPALTRLGLTSEFLNVSLRHPEARLKLFTLFGQQSSALAFQGEKILQDVEKMERKKKKASVLHRKNIARRQLSSFCCFQ
jgi:hypothetical protein